MTFHKSSNYVEITCPACDEQGNRLIPVESVAFRVHISIAIDPENEPESKDFQPLLQEFYEKLNQHCIEFNDRYTALIQG